MFVSFTDDKGNKHTVNVNHIVDVVKRAKDDSLVILLSSGHNAISININDAKPLLKALGAD